MQTAESSNRPSPVETSSTALSNSGLVVWHGSNDEGFSLGLVYSVSPAALSAAFASGEDHWQFSDIPVAVQRAMRDRIQREAQALIDEARPALLASLLEVALGHQIELNKQTILAQGGAA